VPRSKEGARDPACGREGVCSHCLGSEKKRRGNTKGEGHEPLRKDSVAKDKPKGGNLSSTTSLWKKGGKKVADRPTVVYQKKEVKEKNISVYGERDLAKRTTVEL